jgi:hypothetical protein
MPHRDFLEAARTEKSDITLQALCGRRSAEHGVKDETSMMNLDEDQDDPASRMGTEASSTISAPTMARRCGR